MLSFTWSLGLHFSSKNTGKVSIVFEVLTEVKPDEASPPLSKKVARV